MEGLHFSQNEEEMSIKDGGHARNEEKTARFKMADMRGMPKKWLLYSRWRNQHSGELDPVELVGWLGGGDQVFVYENGRTRLG